MNRAMNTQTSIRAASGFTLIELLVAVMIVGILSSIAVPSYTGYVTDARRAQAKQFMMDLAARQEQYMLDNKTYAASTQELGFTNSYIATNLEGNSAAWGTDTQYLFRFDSNGTSATTWELDAFAWGKQKARDKDCQSLTLTSTGLETASGDDADSCW